MYNEELKTRFIREQTTSLSYAHSYKSLFEESEKFELKWELDLCAAKASQLRELTDGFSAVRSSTMASKLSMIKGYAKWCVDNNIPGACLEVLDIDGFGAKELKSKMVSNPMHLQKIMNYIFEPEPEEYVTNIYRCYLWLAYSGFPEEHVFDITNKNVDISNMVFCYDGREYPIYREALPCVKNCLTLNDFAYSHPLYPNVIRKQRLEGDILLRGITGLTINGIRSSIIKRSRKVADLLGGAQMTYNRVRLSGMFYRMYEVEQAGDEVDFGPIAEIEMQGKNYKVDLNIQRRVMIRNLTLDYDVWKQAFKK